MFCSYGFYWIGAAFSASTNTWSWYSGTPWAWDDPKTGSISPGSANNALKANIENNHEWEVEQHDDNDVQYVGLCEKLIGKEILHNYELIRISLLKPKKTYNQLIK